MKWKTIQPYGKDGYTYWISGIYKIVSYQQGQYVPYCIGEGDKNFGVHIGHPYSYGKNGKFWETFKDAADECEYHASIHVPSKSTLKIAEKIHESLSKYEATA